MSCFYENGLEFSCQKCSCCCRIEPGFVYLSQTDLTKLCLWFKFTEEQFIAIYCRKVAYRDAYVLCLREKKNYDCILWNNGCTAYGARPIQCSTYPFWSQLLKSEDAWNENKRNCPGIGRGRLWKKDEIDRMKEMYEQNEPRYFEKRENF
jgi:uncharacterized protein